MEMEFSTLLDNRLEYGTVLYRLSMVVVKGVESGAGRGGNESRLLLAQYWPRPTHGAAHPV